MKPLSGLVGIRAFVDFPLSFDILSIGCARASYFLWLMAVGIQFGWLPPFQKIKQRLRALVEVDLEVQVMADWGSG